MFACGNSGLFLRTLLPTSFRRPRFCFGCCEYLFTSVRCISASDSESGSSDSSVHSAKPTAVHAVCSQRNARTHSLLDASHDEPCSPLIGCTSGNKNFSSKLSSDNEKHTLAESEHGCCDATAAQHTQNETVSNVEQTRLRSPVDGNALSPLLTQLVSSRDATTNTVELLEEELIDDNMSYFALAPRVRDSGLDGFSPTINDPHYVPAQLDTATNKDSYVPGQQITEPGMTRYRIDIQYSGYDFDGWFKSSRRHICVTNSIDPSGRGISESQYRYGTESKRCGHTTSTRPYVKTVLEEAIAIAIDVSFVDVVAAVIPEVGVSVRRLSCHVDIPSYIEMQPRTVIQRATLWLQKRNHPVAILNFTACANQDFHARHSGVKRIYCYRILNRVAPPLFDAGFQWHVDRALDVARMQRFARVLEGTHDYGYFVDPKMANALRRAAVSVPNRACAAYLEEHYEPTSMSRSRLTSATHQGKNGAQAGSTGLTVPLSVTQKVSFEKGLTNLQRAAALPTFNQYGQRVVSYEAKSAQYYRAHTNLPTIRTVDRIDIARQDDEILLWFVGKSFLRHQIRNMVSVLKASGQGLWDEQEIHHVFQSGFITSRKRFARERLPAAPAHGLTLWDVEYPAHYRDDYVAQVDSGLVEESNMSSGC